MSTIFQKILDGEILADKVYEDEHTFAFLDINPAKKGHTLVIPKTPAKDFFELSEEDGKHLIRTLQHVAKAVKKATGAPAMNIISNNGIEAGQIVFHLHFHLIPRFNENEIAKIPRFSYETDEERSAYARKIRDALI